jgi:hypothetical protein
MKTIFPKIGITIKQKRKVNRKKLLKIGQFEFAIS